MVLQPPVLTSLPVSLTALGGPLVQGELRRSWFSLTVFLGPFTSVDHHWRPPKLGTLVTLYKGSKDTILEPS